MRAVLMAGIFLVTLLSGCASVEEDEGQTIEEPKILGKVDVPTDAKVNDTAVGKVVELVDVPFPFVETITVPENATMIRFIAESGTGNSVSVSMSNEDTGRRRCNQQSVVGYNQPLLGARSCSTLTALDAPGTKYAVRASGGDFGTIRIEYLTAPVDGPIAGLHLENLSQATHKLTPTQGLYIPSHDGELMWVEVTLPEGEGPWPTIIASSPYNGANNRLDSGGPPAMWSYWTQDWAKRGYATVNMDVRGYGLSHGCVEVWGINEQLDQAYIVDWVAAQDWSDGSVGFYGQSYVGTTPTAAAVHAPEALKAIIAVAPVINSYEDWHYGGVPNGESTGSPVAYQVLTATPPIPDGQRTDLASMLKQSTSGVCDPSLIPRANDPRAVYNEFYAERDFKKGVGNVKAAVLFTEGFEDANVKSQMIPGWFNEITAPKLGVFGHWLHQHPARMDQEVLFVGWMDHYVKGVDIGFDDFPQALISVEDDLHRTADAWPPQAEARALYLDGSGTMDFEEGTGSKMVDLDPIPSAGPTGGNPVTVSNKAIAYDIKLDAPLPLVAPILHLEGSLTGENGFVEASLYEIFDEGGARLLTWGRQNLALRNGYESYEPLTPGEAFEADMPLRPTEFLVAKNSTLRLVIEGVTAGSLVVAQPQPAVLTVQGTSYLSLPVVPLEDYHVKPLTAYP